MLDGNFGSAWATEVTILEDVSTSWKCIFFLLSSWLRYLEF